MSNYLVNLRIEDHVTTSMMVNAIANVPKITNSSLRLYLIDIALSILIEPISKKIVDQLTWSNRPRHLSYR